MREPKKSFFKILLSSPFFIVLKIAFYASVAACLCLTLACGKRKPPIPPQERVAQTVESQAFQRGDQMILSWKMPARNAAEGDVQHIERIDVYRLAEPLDSALTLSEEEFASRSIVIGTIKVSESDFGLKTMSYVDNLQFSSQPIRLRYSVRLVNASGQRAAFSNFLLVEPTGSIADKPIKVKADVSQEAIAISWTAPIQNINGTTPPNIFGYNIYRAEDKVSPAKLLNAEPEQNINYRDRFFEFGKNYRYFVRTVSLGPSGNKVESSESQILDVNPIDTFRPSAPSALTIAASPTEISLFFAVNPENDIAGYLVYRATDKDLDKPKWQQLTPNLITTNTFKDTETQTGVTYHYYVTATDKAGNVSEPSEIVSETIR